MLNILSVDLERKKLQGLKYYIGVLIKEIKAGIRPNNAYVARAHDDYKDVVVEAGFPIITKSEFYKILEKYDMFTRIEYNPVLQKAIRGRYMVHKSLEKLYKDIMVDSDVTHVKTKVKIKGQLFNLVMTLTPVVDHKHWQEVQRSLAGEDEEKEE